MTQPMPLGSAPDDDAAGSTLTARESALAGGAAARRGHFRPVVAFVAVLSMAPLLGMSAGTMNLLDLWLVYSVAAIGFFWILGLAGRYAFCQTFMMALGGYTCAWVDSAGGPFLVGLAAAVGVCGLAAALIGLLMWRVENFYFAIGTLAVSEIGTVLFGRTSRFTGTNGNVHGIGYPEIFGHVLANDQQIYYLLLGAVACLLVLSAFLIASPVGRDLAASRQHPTVARSCGIPVRRLQLTMFAVGSAVGGLSGALITYWVGFIGVDSFGLDLGVGLFLMVILGGVGSPWGALLGAAFYVFAPELLTGASTYMPIIYGLTLLVVIMAFPSGLTGLVPRLARLWGAPRPVEASARVGER